MDTKNLGLFQSIKITFANLLEIAKTRLELFNTEAQIEKQKIIKTILLGIVGAFCFLLFLITFILVIATAFWESKIYIFSGFAMLFFVISMIIFNNTKKLITKPVNLGNDTITELENDILLLKKELEENVDTKTEKL